MTRQARKALISIVMVVTMALSSIVTIPMVSRHSQAKIQQVIAESKGKPPRVVESLILPILYAAIGSILLGIVAGLVAGRLLPPAEAPAPRGRR